MFKKDVWRSDIQLREKKTDFQKHHIGITMGGLEAERKGEGGWSSGQCDKKSLARATASS